MAIFQLGALVTSIKGSIGGTAFKMQRGTHVMYRKSNGFSKSKLLSNNALGYARWIFTQWSLLPDDVKSGWESQAAISLFPDKFGNQVHLTGRQLYTKCNINLKQIEYFESIDPLFTTVVPLLTAANAVVDFTAKTMSVDATLFGGATAYVEVAAEISINPLQAPIFNRREVLIFPLVTGTETLDLGTEFFSKFPYAVSGYNIRLYLTPMNIYGIKGMPVTIIAGSAPVGFSFTINQAVQSADGSVSLNTSNSWGGNPAIMVYAQAASSPAPSPDPSGITSVGTFTVFSLHYTLLGWKLFAQPWNLRAGLDTIVWISLQAPDSSWLTPQNILLEGDFSGDTYGIMECTSSLTLPDTSAFGYDLYYKNPLVDATSANVFEVQVWLTNWDVADATPLIGSAQIIMSTSGTALISDVFSSIVWNPTLKRFDCSGMDAAYQLNQTFTVEYQIVSHV